MPLPQHWCYHGYWVFAAIFFENLVLFLFLLLFLSTLDQTAFLNIDVRFMFENGFWQGVDRIIKIYYLVLKTINIKIRNNFLDVLKQFHLLNIDSQGCCYNRRGTTHLDRHDIRIHGSYTQGTYWSSTGTIQASVGSAITCYVMSWKLFQINHSDVSSVQMVQKSWYQRFATKPFVALHGSFPPLWPATNKRIFTRRLHSALCFCLTHARLGFWDDSTVFRAACPCHVTEEEKVMIKNLNCEKK